MIFWRGISFRMRINNNVEPTDLCTFTIFKTLEYTQETILSSSRPGCDFTICKTFCTDDFLPWGYSLKAIYLSQIQGFWSCPGGWSRSQWPPAAAAWVVDITEYTQSGNARFLAYIPSWMDKSAMAGEGGGYTPTPVHSIYHHVQSCSVRSWEGRYTLRISSLL